MLVRLEMRNATDPDLVVKGKIYPSGAELNSPAQADSVVVSHVSPWEGELPKGDWVYKLERKQGAGKFELWALNAATGAKLSRDDYDTSVAKSGMTLRFTVPPGGTLS